MTLQLTSLAELSLKLRSLFSLHVRFRPSRGSRLTIVQTLACYPEGSRTVLACAAELPLVYQQDPFIESTVVGTK